MSVTSSLAADWNCLQDQVERSISLAFAGALHNGMTQRIAAESAAATFMLSDHHSSKCKFALLTMSRYLRMSPSMSSRKTVAGPPPGVIARFRNLTDTSESRIASPNAFSSRVTTAMFVAAGAKIPLQRCTSTPGYPDSAILSTLGSSAARSDPVTAIALTLPPLTCGTVGGGSAIAVMVWPSITLRIISLLLLYGIITAGMPDFNFSCSIAIVNAGEVLG